LEIRRGEGGIRAWASEPGEYYHQLDGQYGGLWRRCGRPPASLNGGWLYCTRELCRLLLQSAPRCENQPANSLDISRY
jgi:hypothetical protein